MFDLEEFKTEVAKLLVSNYDFSLEESEETVDKSVREDPNMWNENADADDLAKLLASDENDD